MAVAVPVLSEAAYIAKHYGEIVGHELGRPLGTVTTIDHHALTTASMVKMRGANIGSPVDEPLRMVAQGQHHALTTATLIKYYGTGSGSDVNSPLHTITSKDRMGLVCAELNADGAHKARAQVAWQQVASRSMDTAILSAASSLLRTVLWGCFCSIAKKRSWSDYDKLYSDWIKVEWQAASDHGWRTECLWLSPKTVKALKMNAKIEQINFFNNV